MGDAISKCFPLDFVETSALRLRSYNFKWDGRYAWLRPLCSGLKS